MNKKGPSKQPQTPSNDVTAAIAAYEQEDYSGSLNLLKKNCAPFHHAQAFIHYQLAMRSRDRGAVRHHIDEAAISARQASILCPSSTILAHFCACTLYDLATFDQEYDEVIKECNRALEIKNPTDEISSFFFKDPSQDWEIEKTKQELRDLINKCEWKKRWVAISSEQRANESANAATERVESNQNQLRSLSAEAKSNFFQVRIEELERVLIYGTQKDLFLEAIKFAKERKTWRFWECGECCTIFNEWHSCMGHLRVSHDLKFQHHVLKILPIKVDNDSVELITKGGWKPVDTTEAARKGLEDQNWPLRDDKKRLALLERLCGTLQMLLRYKYLTQTDIVGVIIDAICILKTRFSDSQLRHIGLNSLRLVFFLESSQFTRILGRLQNVSGALCRIPRMDNSMEEQLAGSQTFGIKEELVLSEDSSCLSLDGIQNISDDFVSWLYEGHDVEEAFRLWTSLRESNEVLKAERHEYLIKQKAVEAVDGICGDETKRREKNPESMKEAFASLLRGRKEVLEEGNGNATSDQFELEFIFNLLETDPVTAYQFEEKPRMHESLNPSDDCLSEKISFWRKQLQANVSTIGFHFFSQLGELCACDYGLIVLPILKSFMKARLEQLVHDSILKVQKKRKIIGTEQNLSIVLRENPNTEMGERADDLQQPIEIDDRSPEQNLEYQRQSADEVNALGTGLGKEAADSFLIMLLQVIIPQLYAIHIIITFPCIVCAFFKICGANHQGEAVDPTELRIALSTYDRDRNDPIEGQVMDASEFLVIILRSLHEAFYTGNHDIVPDDLYKGNWDCLDSECWVHRRFGMDRLDHIKCDARICRKESRHQKYSSLFLSLDASSLTKLQYLYNRESFVELFERAVMFGRLNCEYCNRRSIRITHELLRTPKVFTTVISWPRDDESSENISKTWNILHNKVNLKKLYEGINDINDCSYFLLSMVTGSWIDVVSTCKARSLLPKILFYVCNSATY
ncbi:USP domain-containing protein [Citrus sinensis]|uniref:USP domain-containing protein n=1 Tax=Citrus sinensis TaxID=2711 RepID=A0ACB8K4L5_CITSI|nr:USP domain-containing protein [Citrus sinensis]